MTCATMGELTSEQMAAVRHLCGHVKTRQVQTLGGYAGTGKTTVARYLYDKLTSFGVCAFTGKAADVLRRKGLPGQTIHSLIYRPEEDPETHRTRFVLKGRKELGVEGFLVDEASMVSKPIFDDLVSFGLPIIAIGDHGQLPPVGEDAGLMRAPDVRLETIHRNAGPIARFAEHLRKGGRAKDWKSDGEQVFVAKRTQLTDEHLLRADQVICAYNRTRIGLNRQIRRLLDRPELNIPVPGDRVICLKNDRIGGVFNGMQGTVDRVVHDERDMLFAPSYGDPLWVNYHSAWWNNPDPPKSEKQGEPGMDIPFDFAFAITCHKSQGDEFGKVIVFEERCDKLWEHSRWAYTAASRAKDKILWLAA